MCAAGRLRWSSLSGSLWWRRGPTTVTLPASPVPKQVNGAGTGLREDDEGEDLIHIGLSFPGGGYEYIRNFGHIAKKHVSLISFSFIS